MSRIIKLYRIANPEMKLDSEQFIHTMTEANKYSKDGWIVDEVEVVNGGNLQEENRFAQGVVKVVGKKGTGGSDAHSTNGLAKGMTVFHGDIRNQEDLVEALRAGAFTPVENYHIGKTSLYGDLVEDVMPFLQSLDSYDAGPDQKETYGIAE